ncbi:Gfo/Idh/MocA family protein [Nocardioides stalactiti]|uniref:Gfo/Idh/MocA family protein n=1 Tax=Nocardioides stalactiti TaxID=2755356 RepID=UPI0016032E81|nr:Gfo/Idh/MocA family oxidoreductase [Nocardioides stalactiti]
MRFGLIGTGPWAHRVHGPALSSTPGVELVGVWGRSAERAAALGATLGCPSYDDVEALIAEVDAVAFAVPPDVQADLAVLAARSGRHLLLEKPVSLLTEGAVAVRDTARAHGAASLVFHTDRFIPSARGWFTEVQGSEGWRGGWLRWLSSLQVPGNAFGASPWRQARGALWDIGPHAISTLTGALGPIEEVRATGGAADLVVLAFGHASGATSTATLSVFAPPAAAGFEAAVWGDRGVLPMPPRPDDAVLDAFRTAVAELVVSATSGVAHPLDASFGVHVVGLLADAARQLG